MQVEVLNKQGQKTGRSVELPENIFGIEPNDHAIYLAVKQYMAARRQGTHKVKTRAEVKGASRKLHKQKGTGGSRKGNIRNPLYKGGGTIFGPKPHGYGFKLNKKVKDLARISALSYKVKDNALVVVEDIQFDAPKTSQMSAVLKDMELAGKKVLYVLSENNDNVYLSLRNLPRVESSLIKDINTYSIVNADVLLLSEDVVKMMAEAAQEAEALN